MYRFGLTRWNFCHGHHDSAPTTVVRKWRQRMSWKRSHLPTRIIMLSLIVLCLFLGPSDAFSSQNGVTRRASPSTTTSQQPLADPIESTTQSDNIITSSLLIIDVDNVRGKSNFQWTHESLLERATAWRNSLTTLQNVSLALVVDHASIPCLHTSGPLDNQVGIFFSGDRKADDVILSLVQDVCGSHAAVPIQTTIVTADQALMASCQQACPKKSNILDFVEPMSFLQEIESLPVTSDDYTLQLVDYSNQHYDNNVVSAVVMGDSIRREVALRQEVQMLNRLLYPRGTRSNGKRKQISKKQRTKLVARRDRARERLQELLESEQIQDTTLLSVLQTTSDSSLLNGAVQSVTRSRSYSTESTYERQLLAERLRRRLDRAGTLSIPTDEYTNYTQIYEVIRHSKSDRSTLVNGETTESSANANLVGYIRDGRYLSSSVLTVPRRHFDDKEQSSSDDDTPSTLLRIVIISDTHGYEYELFAHYKATGGEATPHLLPPADVLIHCGDFTESGSRKIKLQAKQRLDAFLAAQTHIPTKIVLRGNHDPHTPARVLFPRSKALYVTKPMTMTLQNNVTLGLRPFSRRGTILLLPPCDVLASHEPPYGILDMSYQQVRAGSITLRRAVESSTHKPSLWLCGHIHEGRGSVLHTFCDPHSEDTQSTDSTLVVNAANANAGRANRIVTGPVLVDVVKDNSLLHDKTAWTTGASADTSPVTIMRSDSIQHMVANKNGKQQPNTDNRRLLAVDLGLRTATVVLDGKGDILDVQDWRFTNHSQLEGALQDILQRHGITHVVVEGSDVKLVRIWRRAVEKYFPDLPFARVVAEDWREALLLPKERRNKQTSKDAAVMIAKQFWNSKKHQESKTKLTKDAAEAILVGQHAVRVLGWVDSKPPAVKRYANGNIAT